MREKLLSKTSVSEYVGNAWDGENRSGMTPIGDHVLVLPDRSAETTTGGIHIPDAMRKTHDLASESGVLVAIGDGAWTWNKDRTRKFDGRKPKVGERVSFQRYSGVEQIGADGERYFMMSDASITGIRDAAPASQKQAA